jgi:uncharacterized protein YdaU (DUF1376 family)
MTIATAIEKLTTRFRQRTATAFEQVETAAKTLATGGTVDMASLESALVTAQMGPDDFKARAEFHGERAAKLATLEKLGPARQKAERIDKEIAAENQKHAELTAAYQKRWSALREQADEASREVEDCRRCREWLLELQHAPLHLREEYSESLDVEQKCRERIGDVERLLRQLREKHKDEEEWVQQILDEDLRVIHPPMATVAKSQRDKLGAAQKAKLDEHERRRDRFAREIKEAESDLEAARLELVKAEAAVASIRKKILTA